MHTFLMLSARDLLGEEPLAETCHDLLRGVPFSGLVRFASLFCHNLSAADEFGTSREKFFGFHSWFLENFAAPQLLDRIHERLRLQHAYQGVSWAVTDQHRIANLVLAYARSNSSLIPGDATQDDYDRLVMAQLMANDLVSVAATAADDVLPVAEVLSVYSMARAWSARTTMPRMFDLITARLPQHLPGIGQRFAERLGFTMEDAAAVLFALYVHLLYSLQGSPTEGLSNKPPWSNGLISLKDLRPTHSGDEVMRRVIEAHATSWDALHHKASSMDPRNPSIVWALRRPLIWTQGEDAWCFDPALVLSAASSGLLWLAAEAQGKAGGDRRAVFDAMGPSFEGYLDAFFRDVGRTDVIRGDRLMSGLSDFYLVEGTTLIAIEAKANLLRDEVKWSRDINAIRAELKKVLKNNQLMQATSRFLAARPEIKGSITRIVPAIVVLDPAFASPGFESEVIAAITKPEGPPEIDDPHLLSVSELETAGRYVKAGLLARLLDVRRAVLQAGWVGLDDVITKFRDQVTSALGTCLDPFDAHAATMAALNSSMGKFFEQHGHPHDGGPPI